MPRTSAAASDLAEFAIADAPLEPPGYLTEEQAGYWRALVGAFPRERFDIDSVPVLVELFVHMSISRQIAEALNAMRQTRLIGPSPERTKARRVFIQLAAQARQESHLICVLSTKLRLTHQSQERDTKAARARYDAMTVGTPPWAQQ
jgi:hypothetical protein